MQLGGAIVNFDLWDSGFLCQCLSHFSIMVSYIFLQYCQNKDKCSEPSSMGWEIESNKFSTEKGIISF